MRHLARIILLISCVMVSAFALDVLPGAEMIYAGQGANAMSLSGCGFTQFGSVEGVLYNPAVAGDFRRKTASYSIGGFASDNIYMFGGVALPTLLGVWTVGATFLYTDQDSASMDTAGILAGANVALAKPITDIFYLGLGIDFIGGGTQNLGGDFGLSMDLGAYVKTEINNEVLLDGEIPQLKEGLGFFDFAFGVALKNIGKPVYYDSYNVTESLSIGGGGSFKFLRFRAKNEDGTDRGFDSFFVKPLMDISFPLLNQPMPTFAMLWNMGLEIGIFDIIFIRGGFSPSTLIEAIDLPGFPWSVGIGSKFKVPIPKGKKTDIKFDFAYLPLQETNNYKTGGLFFTVAVGFGYYDDVAPQLNIKHNNTFFSPNFDGESDLVELSLGIEDNDMLTGWKVEIRDEEGRVIKEIVNEGRLKEKLDAKKFFKRLVSKETAVDVPESVEWDGIGWNGEYNIVTNVIVEVVTNKIKIKEDEESAEGADVNEEKTVVEEEIRTKGPSTTAFVVATNFITNIITNKIVTNVSDGKYTYHVFAWDKNFNTNVATNKVYIDSVFPEITLSYPAVAIFSPNGDGNKEKFIITNHYVMDSGDVATGNILNSSGEVVKTFVYTNSMKDTTVWDGLTDSGEEASEGLYSYKVRIVDLAANSVEEEIPSISLIRRMEEASVIAAREEFSPDGNGTADTAVFGMSASATEGLVSWRLSILDNKGIERKFFTGTTLLPSAVTWDGMDSAYNRLPDGTYSYYLSLKYNSGNAPVSETNSIIIDTLPASMALSVSGSSAFSPDGDGTKDTIKFENNITDEKENDRFIITLKNDKGSVVVKKEYSAKDLPKDFIWNGYVDNDPNSEVAPDGMYEYSITTIDSVGNMNEKSLLDIRLDTGVKEAEVDNDFGTISPNGDGKLEAQSFKLSVSDRSGIKSWKFTIESDEKEAFVKTGENTVDHMINWNGRGEDGAVVADGKYIFSLSIEYASGKTAASRAKSFYVDTTPPIIEPVASNDVFSPNGDGRKETFIISHKREEGRGESFKGVIRAEDGKTVRTFNFGENIPASLTWDGRDDKGVLSTQGVYSYVLSAVDAGENKTEKILSPIRMVTGFEECMLVSDTIHFSPNSDEILDTVTLSPSLSSVEGLLSWTLTIADSEGNVVRTFTADTMADKIIWNGTLDDEESLAEDGSYTVTFTANFDSGNIVSAQTDLYLDTQGPLVNANLHPRIFSPDGDGDNDTLYLNLDISDESGVDEWEVLIYLVREGVRSESPFKTFSGKGEISELLTWNGYGNDAPDGTKDDKYLVESASDYELIIRSKDKVGNVYESETVPFYVDILVIKTPNGYKIRISSIQFDSDKAFIKRKYQPILDRLAQILLKPHLRHHTVRIEGHTDTTGGESYNLKLSTKRAESVLEYLVRKGLKSDRFKAVGVGEARPVFEEDEASVDYEEQKARNRRVEFYLEK